MQNWQKYGIVIMLAFAIGFLDSFGQGSNMLDGLRHGAHALDPTLIALQMTLKGELLVSRI